MSRARENANITPAAGRNIIINGAMNVSQRATSVTGLGATNVYATCDRFKINGSSAGAGRLTVTQTADGPNGISANCLKLDCTTADTSIAAGEFLLIQHNIEGQNVQRIGKGVVGAKQVTVSFYVKANAAFNFALEFFDNDNNRQCSKLFATTTDWNRIELTFPADVDDGSSPFDDDNAESMSINFWLHAGATYAGGTLNTAAFANTTQANRAAGIGSFFSSTDNNFFITGLQMEVGPVATEFEQELISTTLQKCYRYFQKQIGGAGSVFERFGSGFSNTSTNFNSIIPMQTAMRATPALGHNGTMAHYHIYHGNSITTALTGLSIDANADGPNKQVGVNATVSSGLTNGAAGMLNANNNATAFISFDAEL